MKDCGRLTYLIAATIAVALILWLTAYKAGQNSQRQARYQERDMRTKAASELGIEVDNRVRMALQAHVTLAAFEEAFGPVTELTDGGKQEHAGKTHYYVHPGSQRTFYLRFQDGRLMG